MRKRVFLIIIFSFIALFSLEFMKDGAQGSSYSSKGHGARAFLTLLQEIGVKAKPWLKSFESLKELGTGNTMVIIDPPKAFPLNDLKEFVEKGNTLIYFGKNRMLEQTFLGAAAKWKQDTDIGELLAYDPFDKEIVRCVDSFSTICAGVREVSNIGQAYDLLPSGAGVVLKNMAGEPLILHRKNRRGQAFLLPQATFILNDYIDSFDNLKLLLPLITSGATANIYFDEFHHGFVPVLGEENVPQLQSLIIFIVLLVLIVAYSTLSQSVRFGGPAHFSATSPTGSSQFSFALGMLFEEHNVVSSLESYLDAWRQRASNLLRVSPQSSVKELLGVLLEQNKLSSSASEEILRILRSLNLDSSLDLQATYPNNQDISQMVTLLENALK